jgi:hypothetical protein
MKATAETPATQGTQAKVGRISGTKWTPARAGMLATAGMNKEGMQATAITQSITVTPTDEMTKTGLNPTPHDFSSRFAKNSREWQKFMKKYKEKSEITLSCSIDFNSPIAVGPYQKSNVASPIVKVR